MRSPLPALAVVLSFIDRINRTDLLGPVQLLGTTTGSHLGLSDDEELRMRVIWVATVRGEKVAAWEIRGDTREERERLGLG